MSTTTTAPPTIGDLQALEARLLARINDLDARLIKLEPLAANAFKLTAPASGATVSGPVQVRGQAGAQWVNTACFNAATFAKLAPDCVPTAGAFAFTVDTTKLPNGQAKLSVQAYTVPPGGTGGTVSVLQLTLNVANPVTPPVVTPPVVVASDGTVARVADFLMIVGGSNLFPSMQANVNIWGSAPADYTPASVIAAYKWLTNGSGIMPTSRCYYFSRDTDLMRQWLSVVGPALGMRFVVGIGVIGGTDTGVGHATALAKLAADPALCIEAIQGINEPNNPDFGVVPIATVRGTQATLWANKPAGVRVLGPPLIFSTPYPERAISSYAPAADMADLIANMDDAAFHLYPFSSPMADDGSGRGGCVPAVVQPLGKLYGGKSLWLTEHEATLYNMVGKKSDAALSGYYTPILLAQLFRAGIRRAMQFPLINYGTTFSCGMFALTGATAPSPAAWAVRALHTILGDVGLNARTFTPAPLAYQIAGLPKPFNPSSPNTGGGHMQLQASDGRRFVLLWNEQLAPGGTPVPVTVTFQQAPQRVREFDVTRALTETITPVRQTFGQASYVSQLDAGFRVLEVTP